MKHNVSKTIALILLVGMLFAVAGCGNNTGNIKKEDAAVEVDGVRVSKNVMNLYFKQMKDYLSSFGIDITDESNADMLAMAEKQAYDTSVSAALIRVAAEKSNIKVDKKELQDAIDKQLAAAFEDDAAYQEWLTSMSMTEDDVNWIWETQLLDEKLNAKFTEENKIAEDEAKTLYEADPDKYNKIAVSHILIGAKEGEATDEEIKAAEEKAKNLINQLNNGADFAELAKANSTDTGSASNGGSYTTEFTVNNTSSDGTTYVPEYVAAAWTLKNVGDYTLTPVKTTYGYHIIKLDTQKITFDALKDDIINTETQEKASAAYSDYLDELQKTAQITQLCEFQYYGKEDTTADDGTATDEGAQPTDDSSSGQDTSNGQDATTGQDSTTDTTE